MVHEILPLQGTAASRQLLKVQNFVLPLTIFPLPPISTHHYSCETKLIFCTTKVMTIKNFTGVSMLKESKISVPKGLIAKIATDIVLKNVFLNQPRRPHEWTYIPKKNYSNNKFLESMSQSKQNLL